MNRAKHPKEIPFIAGINKVTFRYGASNYLSDEIIQATKVIIVPSSTGIKTAYRIVFVSGFGQKKWPVDCRTDLATIIEQIPEILEKIRAERFFFKLDFYEQGIERQLVLKKIMIW